MKMLMSSQGLCTEQIILSYGTMKDYTEQTLFKVILDAVQQRAMWGRKQPSYQLTPCFLESLWREPVKTAEES